MMRFARAVVPIVLTILAVPGFCSSVTYTGTPNPYTGATPWSGASLTIPQYNPALFGGSPLTSIQLERSEERRVGKECAD